VIGAIMEHVELAGVHSGDSACTIPSPNLSVELKQTIRQCTFALAEALNVRGLMNVQYAIKDGDVYVLEVNPRASRTVPFVSKTIGVPLAKLAALVMVGRKLADLGFTGEVAPRHYAVKEAVFPFTRFPGIDVTLTPEMKSTGEVMGIDINAGLAFLKSQVAAGNGLPTAGNVFLSVRDADKAALIPHARRLVDLGYHIYATCGTSTALQQAGLDSRAIFRISDGRPNIIDMIERQSVAWIVNTPSSGTAPRVDEIKMRAHATIRAVPITTTIDGLKAALDGLRALAAANNLQVCSLQEYHRHAPVLKGMPRSGTRKAETGTSARSRHDS
jgi:carbamoyl-phosphate synthase large subunit